MHCDTRLSDHSFDPKEEGEIPVTVTLVSMMLQSWERVGKNGQRFVNFIENLH
jgi:hypothetical protein